MERAAEAARGHTTAGAAHGWLCHGKETGIVNHGNRHVVFLLASSLRWLTLLMGGNKIPLLGDCGAGVLGMVKVVGD